MVATKLGKNVQPFKVEKFGFNDKNGILFYRLLKI